MDKKKLAEVIEDSKEILQEHPLCDHCIGRMFAGKLRVLSHKRLGSQIRKKLKQKQPKSCYICKGLMSELDVHLKKIIDISKNYEFSTFLIGAILQPSIHDRDDLLRSKFKLRGIASIKSDVTREMGKCFSRKTKAKVDYQNPDLVFTIDFKRDQYEIKPKAVLLQGRYLKSIRGFPQKQKPCEHCDGKGCFVCDFHGIKEFDSVEGKIAKFLIEKFGAQQAKITWMGSEDEFSLVLGTGRPFFSKLLNPHRRNVVFSKKIELDGISIHNLHTIPKIPSESLKFRTVIILEVETEIELEPAVLQELENFKDQPITIHENSGYKNKKTIYDIKLKKKSGKSFTIQMESDGGIPIKRFVVGNAVAPNLSSTLETNCKCKSFDFHKITIVK